MSSPILFKTPNNMSFTYKVLVNGKGQLEIANRKLNYTHLLEEDKIYKVYITPSDANFNFHMEEITTNELTKSHCYAPLSSYFNFRLLRPIGNGEDLQFLIIGTDDIRNSASSKDFWDFLYNIYNDSEEIANYIVMEIKQHGATSDRDLYVYFIDSVEASNDLPYKIQTSGTSPYSPQYALKEIKIG